MDPYLGEIRLFSFTKIPTNWLPCDGRLLQVSQNAALFSLLHNQYGGDGVKTFALPDLRGRVSVHRNPMDATNNFYPQGRMTGTVATTLTLANMPDHSHTFCGTNANATDVTPIGAVFANTRVNIVSDQYVSNPQMSGLATAAPMMLGNAGTSFPVTNMQPYLVLNYCIAILGEYPPRN